MTFGVTANGFIKKDFVTCFNELVTEYKAKYGNELKTTGDSLAGNLIGIKAEREAVFWEQLESVYTSRWIQFSNGESLDNACALIGVSRIPARYSTIETATLTNNTSNPVTVPLGSLVKQSSTGVLWQTVTTVVIPANNTITVSLRSNETGSFSATIGSIDTIVSLINGWAEVTNNTIAILGRDRETDTELRIRANNELVSSKGGVGEAIANRLRNEVNGVNYVAWKENRTNAVVGGLLPHSFLFVVVGGNDNDIANMIYNSKPAGIETNGSEVVSITDDFGNSQNIKFDRAYEQDIYLIVNITKDTETFPTSGASDLIKKLLVDYGKTLGNGQDLYNHYLIGSLAPISGITDIEILQGTSPTPTTSNTIVINSSDRANILISNIIVNIS
jgi:uncharacterized phage protein gp47/JayE